MTVSPQLHYYHLGEGVTAFSTKRQGGVSQGNYAGFNINYYCGDRQEDIETNKAALCRMLGIDQWHLVYPHQTHGDVVRAIDGQWMDSLSPAEKTTSLEGVDAVMTNLSRACIGVSTADCIPILLYDATHRACCAVHAGWRGTVKRIAQKAVQSMTGTYGSVPQQLQAVIGPGISLESFEVGDEVYEQFEAAAFPMERIARRYKKWHIDLWEANKLMLLEAGVPQSNIAIDGTCTYKNTSEYFSARRLGIDSGRIFTGVMILK